MTQPHPIRPRVRATDGTRRRTTRTPLLVAAGLLAAALAGCSGTAHPARTVTVTATSSSAPSPSPSASAPSATTSAASPSPSATSAASAPRCTIGRLAGAWHAGGGAGGTAYGQLSLTNTGSTDCSLQGWPGVSLVGEGRGVQLGDPAQETTATDGTRGRTIVLARGQAADARVGIATAANYGAECRIATADGFRVYPPGSADSLFIRARIQACRSTSIHLLFVQPLTAQG